MDLKRHEPDLSELDAGWDFEAESYAVSAGEMDSLRPSYASLQPRVEATRRAAPRSLPPLRAAALIVTVGLSGGALAAFALERPQLRAASTAAFHAAPTDHHRPASPIPREPAPSAPPLADRVTLPKARRVLLTVEPPRANVIVHGRRVGASPVTLELGPNESASATVELPGYRTRVVEVDGTKPSLHIRLDSMPAPPRKKIASTAVRLEELPPSAAHSEPAEKAESGPPSEANLAYPEPDAPLSPSPAAP
ncbi:MAG TPA: PEGA domain-containing protein [Polyangiaceae bacterium]|nr:PEGA domain-containing protein [Polyangiaceae bacterium]